MNQFIFPYGIVIISISVAFACLLLLLLDYTLQLGLFKYHRINQQWRLDYTFAGFRSHLMDHVCHNLKKY